MSASLEEGRGYHAELRAILGKHFPGESWPDNLLPDLWKAMRRANADGFDACLKYFDGRAEHRPTYEPTPRQIYDATR